MPVIVVKIQLGLKDNPENHLKNALSSTYIKLGGGLEIIMGLDR
jgi:hypothetical protein